MPTELKPRQERFCQLVRQGIVPYRAYPLAGYQPSRNAPYRLYENVRVKARLAELTKGFAMKTRVTVETISEQLDEDRAFAHRVEQAGPALNATIAKAKLHGLIVDRKETGAPGDFAGLQEQDVIELVRKELGEQAAALLVSAIDELPVDATERGPDEPLN
jgi:hypothetical protein